MDVAKLFGTDKDAEQEGVWIEFGSDGARVLIARQGNPRYQETIRRLRRPYANFRAGQIPEAIALEIFRKVTAETVLLGWEGITLDGKPLPYSYDNALKLITDYPDFHEMVTTASSNLANFQIEVDEERAGNSSKSSTTSKVRPAA